MQVQSSHQSSIYLQVRQGPTQSSEYLPTVSILIGPMPSFPTYLLIDKQVRPIHRAVLPSALNKGPTRTAAHRFSLC